MDVGQGGAAERGGLMVGDRIVSIRGQQPAAFSNKTDTGLTGPQTDLAVAIEQACADEPHLLQVTVQRKGETVSLEIPVPASRAFAFSFPNRCAKSQKYLAAIAEHLVATQRKDGSWKPGVGGDADVYTSAFCALALLASDNAAHRPSIQRAIGSSKEKASRRSRRLTRRWVPKTGRPRRLRFFLPSTN
jgi:hypothetical protein